MFVAVSGNLGSGKTTAVRALASELGWDACPQRPYNRTYIDDQFRDPLRWTFEAQLSFLLHKYKEIDRAILRGRPFLLDRTLDEEVKVFALKHHEYGWMDDRAMTLLQCQYNILRSKLPTPQLIIFCEAPAELCRKRLSERKRQYQAHYPEGHLHSLESKLHEWINSVEDSLVLVLDTAALDLRMPTVAQKVAQIVDAYIKADQRGGIRGTLGPVGDGLGRYIRPLRV